MDSDNIRLPDTPDSKNVTLGISRGKGWVVVVQYPLTSETANPAFREAKRLKAERHKQTKVVRYRNHREIWMKMTP
jgi:hypothetical protein